MKKEKSVGAIIFCKNPSNSNPDFLLLNYSSGHWDYCKGHIEKNESELETLKRELFEETGIKNFKLIPGFKESIHYFFKKNNELISKEVVFYLLEVNSKKVKLSFEHKAFKWLSFNKALNTLTYDTAKKVLIKADEFLKQKNLFNFN